MENFKLVAASLLALSLVAACDDPAPLRIKDGTYTISTGHFRDNCGSDEDLEPGVWDITITSLDAPEADGTTHLAVDNGCTWRMAEDGNGVLRLTTMPQYCGPRYMNEEQTLVLFEGILYFTRVKTMQFDGFTCRALSDYQLVQK
jgi:hypothetical protein